jgi:signal transduction histidine kinase
LHSPASAFKKIGALVFSHAIRVGRSAPAKYLIAISLAVAGTSFDDLVQPKLYHIPLLVLLICETLSALIGGWGPGLLTLALGVIGIDLVLAHPLGAVALISPEGEIRLGTFLVVALGFCGFGAWLRSAYLTVLSQREQLRAALETQRALAAAEIARAKAEEANEAKDEFLALISHELRAPLQGMLSWLELLRQDNVDPRIKQSAPEVMRRCVETQRRLVDDLLEASRLIARKIEIGDYPVDVARELGDVIAPMVRPRDRARPARTETSGRDVLGFRRRARLGPLTTLWCRRRIGRRSSSISAIWRHNERRRRRRRLTLPNSVGVPVRVARVERQLARPEVAYREVTAVGLFAARQEHRHRKRDYRVDAVAALRFAQSKPAAAFVGPIFGGRVSQLARLVHAQVRLLRHVDKSVRHRGLVLRRLRNRHQIDARAREVFSSAVSR